MQFGLQWVYQPIEKYRNARCWECKAPQQLCAQCIECAYRIAHAHNSAVLARKDAQREVIPLYTYVGMCYGQQGSTNFLKRGGQPGLAWPGQPAGGATGAPCSCMLPSLPLPLHLCLRYEDGNPR